MWGLGVGLSTKRGTGKGKARRRVTRIIFTLPVLHGNSVTLVRTARPRRTVSFLGGD